MKRADVLHDAERCICGQREQDYGSPEVNFGIIAKLWSDYTGTLITSLDVAMMMCLLKIARIKNGGTGDSFVDLAGYAACGGEIADNKVNVTPADIKRVLSNYRKTEADGFEGET